MVLLIFGLSLAIAGAQERVVKSLQANVTSVKLWGGRILLLVGAWFFLLAVFANFFADVFPV